MLGLMPIAGRPCQIGFDRDAVGDAGLPGFDFHLPTSDDCRAERAIHDDPASATMTGRR